MPTPEPTMSIVEGSGTSGRSGAQAIERALAVLLCFEGDPELGVADVARRTGLSTSTAHRVLRALRRGGLLAQNPGTGAYQLGPSAVALGELAGERLGFTTAMPQLKHLANVTGAAVSLGVREGRESLIVAQVPSPKPDGVEATVGIRSPVHACALGKSLIAFDSSSEPLEPPLRPVTDHTITDLGALQRDLARIRERGWSLNDEELVLGVRSIGAPVFDAFGQVSAAVGIAMPSKHLPAREFRAVASAVREAADTLRGVIPRLTVG
jgi:IclR family transcriptional regulator, acetate operon repressor